MGAGKTSVGKRLAAKLGREFVDSDRAIENQMGNKIAEIFEEFGESHFRKLEKDFISNLSDSPKVIGLGGGTPCQEGMMELINSKGITVFLNVSVGILVARLMNAEDNRPLISEIKADKDKLTAFVNAKIQEREKHYRQANFIFDANDINATKMQSLIDELSSVL